MAGIFIIAEAGVNHNGDIGVAAKMIDAAVAAGADAIKFQTFRAESLASSLAPKAEYQTRAIGEGTSQLEMLKALELSADGHRKLFRHCQQKEIMFLSSPFDLGSIDLLDGIGLEMFKIPSGEITDLPYLRKIGRLRKKIILSSGMSDMEEIGNALRVLVEAGTPKDNITVLQCNSEYPTPVEDANLLAMLAIRDAFQVDVGYSDHTLGIEVAVAAAALGASVIEKHFTLDRTMAGPDHQASLEPEQLGAMIAAVRNVEKALGDGIKVPRPSELKNRAAARKSIVAARAISKGETFTEQCLSMKRPGTGVSPMEIDRAIGKKAKRDFGEGEPIEL